MKACFESFKLKSSGKAYEQSKQSLLKVGLPSSKKGFFFQDIQIFVLTFLLCKKTAW